MRCLTLAWVGPGTPGFLPSHLDMDFMAPGQPALPVQAPAHNLGDYHVDDQYNAGNMQEHMQAPVQAPEDVGQGDYFVEEHTPQVPGLVTSQVPKPCITDDYFSLEVNMTTADAAFPEFTDSDNPTTEDSDQLDDELFSQADSESDDALGAFGGKLRHCYVECCLLRVCAGRCLNGGAAATDNACAWVDLFERQLSMHAPSTMQLLGYGEEAMDIEGIMYHNQVVVNPH